MSEILTTPKLITPYGGSLVDLTTTDEQLNRLIAYAKELTAIQLSDRTLCDLELLATGAFSPLDRFMGSEDYSRVVSEMRLNNGQLFPIPVTLPVSDEVKLTLDSEVSLVNSRNEIVALMMVEEIYEWNLEEAAQKIFETVDVRHPLVAEMHRWGRRNVSGRLRLLQLPRRYDFRDLRMGQRGMQVTLKSIKEHTC